METELRKILLEIYKAKKDDNDEAVERILILFNVSKRNLIESILDEVKQSHSEYAVEKIESYLDDGC